ncbi:N-acetylmuramoyl-L-alanine amidase [Rhodoligotrophos appendicifer]
MMLALLVGGWTLAGGAPTRAMEPAADAPEEAAVHAIASRVAGDARRTRFVLDLDQPIPFSVYVVDDPFRVIIDLPNVGFQLPAGIGAQGRGLIREYRYGRFEAERSRVVIDANQPVLIDKSFMVSSKGTEPARLVIDLIGTDAVTFAKIKERIERQGEETRTAALADLNAADPAEAPEPAAAAPQTVITAKTDLPPVPRPRPLLATASETMPATTAPAAAETTLVALTLPAETAAPKGAGSEGAVVEPTAAFGRLGAAKPEMQKPVERRAKPIVVIDPGHGGIDPGAISKSGTFEKDVVLGFAKVLRDRLQASGRYDVVMTRSNDSFLTLGNRVRVAQKKQADLFISIHADSLKRGVARGSTVYTVSDKASDREAAEIAAAENKADLVAGVEVDGENEELTGILIDLVQRETRNHSVFFAKTLVNTLDGTTMLSSKPHRYAGFRVLRAADVPSVLVELGYLSSSEDEKLLTSSAWRQKVARSMQVAVDGFFGTHVSARQ